MKFALLTSRVVAGGATAALAAAGLVGLSASTASAAPVSTTYSCASLSGTFSAAVTVDIALLPATAPAGYPVPAGLLGFNSTFKIDSATATGLGSFGVTGAKSDDFGTAFGETVTKAPVVWNTSTTNPDSSVTFSGKGANGAFTLPEAGTYDVTMPKAFTMQGTNSSGQPVTGATANCTSATPTKISSITLSKQVSKVKAKATPKSAKKGSVVTVKGKVTNEYVKTGGPEATGKLIIKDGKKKIGTAKLKKGKFVVKVKGLSVGSHSLTVLYKGDGYSDKAVSKALKVTITS